MRNGGHVTENDMHLFAALRALSIVLGIIYPSAVDAYRKRRGPALALIR
jgi:glutaredoxin 2